MNHHILMDVEFLLPDRTRVSLELVVDTGYVGTLALPPGEIKSLGLPFLRTMAATLADGSFIDTDVHLATIVWHGFEQKTEVIVLDDRPLLGMVLLDGSQMNVHFEDTGLMELIELS